VNATSEAVNGKLDLDGVVLAYDEAGQGSAVVYAHGLSSSRANDPFFVQNDWSPVVAAGHRLIRYDARGHGESGGRADEADYTWSSLAWDLLAVLDRVAGPQPADVMGASMGCATLLYAALQRPERFRRLVLVIPPTAWETRPELVRNTRALAELVERRGMSFVLAAAGDEALPPVLARAPRAPQPPDVREHLYPHLLRGAAASDLPAPETFRTLAHPALILTWADDPGHPVSTARKLAEVLPNARLHISADYDDVLTWGERAARFLA
jgi:pimeloyl-ACP methyl ester carboxylesterase